MSYGAGGGEGPVPPGGLLASEAERERTQAVLKQAFEDQRLTQDEFESRVGSAISARTLDQLAALTRDLPADPVPVAALPRRSRRVWLFAGIGAAAVVVLLFSLISAFGSGPAQQPSNAAAPAKAKAKSAPRPVTPPGPGRCPVGTSEIALAIANSLANDPVYVEPGSSLLTPAQAGRLRAAIGLADPGRIRLAAVSTLTVHRAGGERGLANAISSCAATGDGVTVVTTDRATYLVTSYADYQDTSKAVGAALNTHGSLAAGLKDAVHRMAAIDPGN